MNRIKVMLVDDSALVRRTLSEVLSSDPQIEIIATAQDPFVAVQKLRKVVPDVMILDVEMPRMDGITFLQKIMSQHPLPVIICSTLVERGGRRPPSRHWNMARWISSGNPNWQPGSFLKRQRFS